MLNRPMTPPPPPISGGVHQGVGGKSTDWWDLLPPVKLRPESGEDQDHVPSVRLILLLGELAFASFMYVS